jgi:glycosyltransferase involved in cell wall biosynthesis
LLEGENILVVYTSVIITTKNEEKHIRNCIESIKNQTYPQEGIEIIVVDNNSNDRTKEISAKYTEKIYNFGPERSAQRNYGARQAKGKYILYLDADMILSEDVIKECAEKCENDGFIALYIPERIIGESFWIRVRDFERSFYNATVIDCVRFISRDKFLEIGGFDETLTGPEDWDFDRRIRAAGRVGIIVSAIYHNEGRFCLSRYLNKKKYYGKAFERYINKWGRDDILIRKQFGFFYRFFGVFMEAGKWKKAIVHPLLLSGVYFLRFFVGIGYLLKGGQYK